MRIRGSVDGVPFTSSLMPRGGGTLFVVVNQELRTKIGKTHGETIQVEMEVDTRPVVISVPQNLKVALAGQPKAMACFEGLAPSHRKAYVRWIEEAKKPETRERRVAKAVAMLVSGKTLT